RVDCQMLGSFGVETPEGALVLLERLLRLFGGHGGDDYLAVGCVTSHFLQHRTVLVLVPADDDQAFLLLPRTVLGSHAGKVGPQPLRRVSGVPDLMRGGVIALLRVPENLV